MISGFRQRGGIWYTRLQGRSVSTGCHDLRAAQIWRAQREREMVLADVAPGAVLREVLEALLADRRRAGRAEATLEIHRCKSGHLKRILGPDRDVNTLRSGDVMRYIDRRLDEGAHRHTIKKEIATLRLALKLARWREEWSGSVEAMIPEFSAGYHPRRRVLEEEELPLLLRRLPEGRRPAILFFLFTGARLGELERLRWSHVRQASVHLPGTKTEEAPREIPLLPQARSALEGLRPGAAAELVFSRWSNLHRDLKLACAEAGLEPLTPNDLRRTFATWLRRRGVDAATVAALLGHTTSTMVERVYGRIDLPAKGRALSVIAGIGVASQADAPGVE